LSLRFEGRIEEQKLMMEKNQGKAAFLSDKACLDTVIVANEVAVVVNIVVVIVVVSYID